MFNFARGLLVFTLIVAASSCSRYQKLLKSTDYEIFICPGEKIGVVTSGTQSPSLQKAIGMGYVKTEYAKENSEIYINIRDKVLKAKVVKVPFYKV